MSSTKEIRLRIKAIGNTAKITNAMEMVAASKMKKAQDSTLKNRPYAINIYDVIFNLAREKEISHPLLLKKAKPSGKNLLVVVTSDKGLCGSFNTAVLRKAAEYVKVHPNTDFISVGKKGQGYLSRLNKNIVATFVNFPIHPHILDIRPILKIAKDGFLKDYDEVAVCYTDFVSTLKQTPLIKTLLPMGKEYADAGEPLSVRGLSEANRLDRDPKANGATPQQLQTPIVIKFEPNPKEVIDYIIPRILETQLFQMVLESIASEQSSRMVAMKNATEAANDLIDDLNLTYNSIRQANITQELAEISAGANLKERNE